MEWIDLAQEMEKWAGCCECRNEPPGSVNYRVFLDCLRKECVSLS